MNAFPHIPNQACPATTRERSFGFADLAGAHCGGFFILVVAFCVGGCASLPNRSGEYVIQKPVETRDTAWGRALSPHMTTQDALSGVELLPEGREALAARLALADTAERCLDVQYYIWESDHAGLLMTERLLQAADRGVHVRLMLDDVGAAAPDDALGALASHTNIEVRLFNPIPNRFFRTWSFLLNYSRVNRRMHNKSLTADRLVTVLGGRNMSDRYFAAGDQPRFADFDVMAAGPAGEEVSAMFDSFWSSRSAFPIHALTGKRFSSTEAAARRAAFEARLKGIRSAPENAALETNVVAVGIREHEPRFTWGKTKLICDLPEKISRDPDERSTHLLPQLRAVVDATTNELFVVSPYFVPGPRGVELFQSLRKRNVRVEVLVNSLASTDVTAVHTGYRRYRKKLLEAGVELFELKPTARLRSSGGDKAGQKRHPSTSLHAKAFVFDQKTLFVGSLNLDPRSDRLNTEMGLLIEIPELAGATLDAVKAKLQENTYRLELVPSPSKGAGSIVWIDSENGRQSRYTSEPAPLSRRFLTCCFSVLPIESQL